MSRPNGFETNGEFAKKVRKQRGTQEAFLKSITPTVSLRTLREIENSGFASIESLRIVANGLGLKSWLDLLAREPRDEFLRVLGRTAKLTPPTPSPAKPASGRPGGELTLHGFSGRWNLYMEFSNWNKLPIKHPESVTAEGHIDLWLPTTGQPGCGSALATLHIQQRDPAHPERVRTTAVIRVADQIEDVRYSEPGCLTLKCETHCRHVEPESAFPHVRDRNKFIWNLKWKPDKGKLGGKQTNSADGSDYAKITLWRG